jgi:hypothetical protein
MKTVLVLPALLAVGCNFVDSNGLHVGYAFDVQHFAQALGDQAKPQTVPNVPCQSGASPDACAQAAGQLPPTTLAGTEVSCQSNACAAQASFTLPQKIDLRNAMTSVPSEAVQFGINAVAIDRVAYWVSNQLNVRTPMIELYVAPDTAKDINDANAVKLGSVAPVDAGSTTCNDPMDTSGDTAQLTTSVVCDVPLTDAGQKKLASFVQNYRNAPFQILVHATLTAKAGEPLPAGSLDVWVRPSVTLSILR